MGLPKEFLEKFKIRLEKALADEIEFEWLPGHKIPTSKTLLEAYEEWKKKVELPLEQLGAIGGEFTYCQTPTSLGTVYIVKHSSGDQFDLTFFDTW